MKKFLKIGVFLLILSIFTGCATDLLYSYKSIVVNGKEAIKGTKK